MKTIGIIGGGQLGLMIAEQARELGVRTVCLDPAADAPAFNVCDDHIVAAYDDAAALEELCRRSDAVTYEFENVPGDILIPLCGKYNIPQGYKPLYDSQDRLREKSNARDHGLRTPGFEAVDDEASLREAVRRLGLPAVLKTRTLGYDGHGQRVLKTEADIAGALPLLAVPCILEEFVPFDSEASIVMVADGERVVSFPVGRNVHRDGILDLCIVPAEVDSGVLALDDTRVVDKDVNHADFFLNLGDEGVDGGFVGHVADIAVRLDALFGIGSNALIHQFLLNVVEYDGRAGVAHGAGDGEADTVGRTGDEGDFALQREHIAHGKSPFNYRG